MKTTVSAFVIYSALKRGDEDRETAMHEAHKAAIAERMAVEIPVARKWFGLGFVMGHPTQQEAEDYVTRRAAAINVKDIWRIAGANELRRYILARNSYNWHQEQMIEFGALQPDHPFELDLKEDKTIWRRVVAYIASGGVLVPHGRNCF